MNGSGRGYRWLMGISFFLVAALAALATAVYFLRFYQRPAFFSVSEMAQTIERQGVRDLPCYPHRCLTPGCPQVLPVRASGADPALAVYGG